VVTGDFKAAIATYERQLLARALAQHRYNQRQTADALGLTYDQLRHALRRHDMLGQGA
jgi:psp operon transcriptional activator